MKKGSDSGSSNQKLGSFLSPVTQNYREKSIENNQKGWSSERVVLQPTSNSSRRRRASLTPFNSSGRTIPSKWDDAERWISSTPPVSGSYAEQHQRRPKSKSGPIVPQQAAYYSSYSPSTIPLRHGLVVKNLMMGSPFTTGVLAPDALSLHHFYSHDTFFGASLPSLSNAPLWSELLCDPSSPISQDEKQDGTKNGDSKISPIPKIDKGTQMSPPETEKDDHSSPKSSLSLSIDQKSCNSSGKLEIRDVQVDSEATVVRLSKRCADKELKKISTEEQGSGLGIAESTLDASKFEREEAKITAWESLQKAKAEAAMRKLEMKLEKRRSTSMDKILNKLRRAQIKAEKMRSNKEDQQVSNKTWKVFSFPKYALIWPPSRCFSGHAP